jgi:hypothetical protein
VEGRTIVQRRPSKASYSIRVNCEFDSNEMMKAIDNLKNNLNEELEHLMESQLTEAMKMKMQMI